MIQILEDPDADRDRYLGEMLSLWGLSCWTPTDGSPEPVNGPAVLIVPPGVSPPASTLTRVTEGGGHLVLIAPDSSTCSALGIDTEPAYGDDGGLSFIRLSSPLLHTYSLHFVSAATKFLIVGLFSRHPSVM